MTDDIRIIREQLNLALGECSQYWHNKDDVGYYKTLLASAAIYINRAKTALDRIEKEAK